jgi:pilus assembly protein CpaD
MKRLTILAAAASALSLAACANHAPRELPRASAEAETFRAAMPVPPGYNGLTWGQQGLIDSVASEYRRAGRGPLVISYPVNAGNADAAIGAIAEARTRLYEAGIDWRSISGGTYQASGRDEAPVIFSFTRYRAVAEPCPEGWGDLRPTVPGEQWPAFGCATANNIASMVADPGDLLGPRAFGLADTGRRQTVIDAYRQGQPTASTRGEDESGAVSSAVD